MTTAQTRISTCGGHYSFLKRLKAPVSLVNPCHVRIFRNQTLFNSCSVIAEELESHVLNCGIQSYMTDHFLKWPINQRHINIILIHHGQQNGHSVCLRFPKIRYSSVSVPNLNN